MPNFDDLTSLVGDWSQLVGKEAPAWARRWLRPGGEQAMLSFEERFVDKILAEGLAVPSQGCHRELCISPSEYNVSATDYPFECCVAAVMRGGNASEIKAGDVQSAREYVEMPFDDLVSHYSQYSSPAGPECVDLLEFYRKKHSAAFVAIYMGSLASVIRPDGSCEGGCPFDRPLCDGRGSCVELSCNNLTELDCSELSAVGRRSRFICGKSCGCDSLLSPLWSYNDGSGCPTACRAEAEAELQNRPCKDLQPGSTELANYASLNVRPDEFKGPLVNFTVKEVVDTFGCTMLQFVRRGKGYYCDPSNALAMSGQKSFRPFCPETCGCTSSHPGCPGTCLDQPPMPLCSDLSNHQLGFINRAMADVEGWSPYPTSCEDFNATVCSDLKGRNALVNATLLDEYIGPVLFSPCPRKCDVRPSHNLTATKQSNVNGV